MFGKGIYFANMSSKSANYCFTNREKNTGILILNEVALGETYDRYGADYITTLPKGKSSVRFINVLLMFSVGGVEIPLQIQRVTKNWMVSLYPWVKVRKQLYHNAHHCSTMNSLHTT
jgi:hypothetical protein